MKKLFLFGFLLVTAVFGVGCSDDDVMQDGYYTAETSDYDFGWKEFVTITVKNNEIVSVEYNAKNPSGFIKSWDNAYMRNMGRVQGVYPNKYTREYASELLKTQSKDKIDDVSGATSSGAKFKALAEAVIEQAKKGDSSIVSVQIEPAKE